MTFFAGAVRPTLRLPRRLELTRGLRAVWDSSRISYFSQKHHSAGPGKLEDL